MYRRKDKVTSGSSVSSVVSSFTQKSCEGSASTAKAREPVTSKSREPLSSRDHITNRGPVTKDAASKPRVTTTAHLNVSHSVNSHRDVDSSQAAKKELANSTSASKSRRESTNSTKSDSRRSSTNSVPQTESRRDSSSTISTCSADGDLSKDINSNTENMVTPMFVNPEQSGYVGFANLPNQVHRKSVKKGFEFTLMVVGESGLGKSTLVNSLFLTDLYPERHIPSAQEKVQQTVKIDASTVEIEERGVKLRLTVVDTPGFGDSLNSIDCFKPIIQYIDDQFERYLNDESGLNRRHIIDNRVHCCFYFINPSGHGMRPLDIAFMKAVHHKVNIVPVIAKSDTLTKKEIVFLKTKIMKQIEQYGICLYPLPDCDEDEDEEYREQCRQLKEAVPFAVVGSNTIIEVKGKKVRGRMFPWGVVEVENPDHCDFIKLRTMLITHMQDLQEVTQEVHYENFRAERLATGGSAPVAKKSAGGSKRRPNEEPPNEPSDQREMQLQEKERELRKMQEMLARMQAEMEAQKQGVHQNGNVRSHNV